MTCSAKNSEGSSEVQANVIVNDLDEEFAVWSVSQQPITAKEEFTLICGASANKYATELNWFKDNVLVENGTGNTRKIFRVIWKIFDFLLFRIPLDFTNHLDYYTDVVVTPHDTPYSHRKEIHWANIELPASGRYICRANIISDDSIDEKSWDLDVKEPSKPFIESTTIGGRTERHSLGEPFKLSCTFTGRPRPEIHWYKDDMEIVPDANDTHVNIDEDNSLLNIRYIKMEDQAKYRCEGTNRYGKDYRETSLKITGELKNEYKQGRVISGEQKKAALEINVPGRASLPVCIARHGGCISSPRLEAII